MVRRWQTESGHRMVQPIRVSRQRERHSVDDLAGLENTVADGQAVVERGYGRSRGAHPFTVAPHPARDGPPTHALIVHTQLAHCLGPFTLPASQMPAPSGEPPKDP